MKNFRNLLIIAVIQLSLLFSMRTSIYSASINMRIENMDKIANMNGFVDAMDLDEETIKKIRKDRGLLKVLVEESVEKYLGLLKEMNK
ncbi:MAG: hypothetical protein JRI86_01515 [Deltaproteobacteria bacterium]|nr:hypothetical protein [Deltaproteobacteria bacterium]